MKNFIEDGCRAVIVGPSGGLVSGQFYLSGSLFGVAEGDIAEAAEGVIVREGVFELPKVTGTAWVQGDQLYWDASAAKFTKVATGNTPVGMAFIAAASADDTGQVSIEAGLPETTNAVIGVAAGYKVARGETALDGSNPTPVAHGLTTCVAFAATLKGTAAPGVGTSVLTANINGANVDVYAWKPTSNADPTLIASTGTESFYWVAIGT